MIVKFFELKKKKLDQTKFFLLYGKNKGLIEETLNNVLKPILPNNIFKYEENEILNSIDSFIENIRNKSLFDDKKLIIIQRATDKILKIVNEMLEDNLEGITLIVMADILEKKSKLRIFFEKNKSAICVAFYEDNIQSLNIVARNFLLDKKIKLSQQNINLIIERSRGDRNNLKNELIKIESLLKNRKNISVDEIFKLTNLAENYNISELVDNSLAKNKSKTINIINENNFNTDDNILILKTYLSKLKRLLKIKSEEIKNKSLETTLSSIKPPIFWKDREIVKEQVQKWDLDKIQDLIIKTNKIEFEVKKYPAISSIIVLNFIFENIA
tara:strand:+ start:33 stop:1016 length:984 start_codon:yes stop_codon:yes gene_type:complete